MTDPTNPAPVAAPAPAAAPVAAAPAPAVDPSPAPTTVAPVAVDPKHESVLKEVEDKLKEFEGATEAAVKAFVEHVKAWLASL